MLRLKRPDDLATALGFPLAELQDVAKNMHRHVREKAVTVRGKPRDTWRPSRRLAAIQGAIIERLLDSLPISDCAHAYRKGRSIVSAASPHAGTAFLLSMDVKSFFPRTHHTRVYQLWLNLGCHADVARLLTKLTTYNGELATGLRTSNAISNLLFARVDARVKGLCQRCGLEYTRYSDNLTISGPHIPDQVTRLAAQAVRDEGMSLPPQRAALSGPGCRKVVTRLVVNEKVNVGKGKCREIRAEAHRYSQDPGKHSDRKRRSIEGKINFVCYINPVKGASLKRLMQEPARRPSNA